MALWQDPDLPTGITLDGDEQILKKYNILKQRIEFPKSCTPENIALLYQYGIRRSPTIVESFGNLLFTLPEIVFDKALLGLREISGDGGPDSNLTSKVLQVESTGSFGHLFPEFMTFLAEREGKFFAGLGNSYLTTIDVERGVADVNQHDLMIEEKKVLWDVLKKTYFSKYKFKAEERIHDDAFYVNQWRGIDFITLPPFIGAYLYYRGLDKNFSILGSHVHVLVEPLMRFTSSEVVGAIAIEWKPSKEWPIGIIASTGLHNSKPEFEFIGIGTSIGAVQKAIKMSEAGR